VSEVLDVSAQRIGAQLSTERRLAADVSHQLRTPLTALSMRLEEVLATSDPQVARAEAEIALQQVERLSHVVDDLLAYARNSPTEQADVELDAVLARQADEWRGAYAAAGRTIVVTGHEGLVVRGSASGLGQVVATLLENALVHGAGVTTVRTRTSGRWTVVDVSDEGRGVPAELGRRVFERDVSGGSSTGLGLAVARALTEVEGGRLELTRRAPATFSVFLAPVPFNPQVDQQTDRQPGGLSDQATESSTPTDSSTTV
jgi:signal transduction histidine kinase